MQDILAIAVAVLTGAWLLWSLGRRLARPSCGPPPATPPGSDGFVSLEDLTGRGTGTAAGSGAETRSGRPAGRPDRLPRHWFRAAEAAA